MTGSDSPSAVGVISPREAHDLLRQDAARLVDVREPDEYAAERIPGATLLPLSKFHPDSLTRFAGKPILIHCRSGRRSADACRLALAGNPDLDVRNVSGGILAWKEQGLPTVSGSGGGEQGGGGGGGVRISVMRQVQIIIGLGVLLGAGLAWFKHPAWVLVDAFFGAGLVFAGATGTCGMAAVVAALPWNRTPSCPT